jgi:microcystin-dependent protein
MGLDGVPETAGPSGDGTSIADLADQIGGENSEPSVVMRVGQVTAIEVSTVGRVQTDISGTAWINRLQDTSLNVGDRVSILQQGPVMLVVGRLDGGFGTVPVGAVTPYAASSAPAGWLACDGSAVSRTTYSRLFAVIGTTYGAGNGTTTFNLPNMVDRMAVGSGSTYTLASTGGSASTTLASGNLPSHSHSFSDTSDSQGSHSHSLSGSTTSDSHSHSVGNQSSRSDILAGGGTTTASTGGGSTGSDAHSHTLSGTAASAGGHTHTVSGTTGATGSSSAFSTISPYLALRYIIRAL